MKHASKHLMLLILSMSMFVGGLPLSAQPGKQDPIADQLYPVELIMHSQSKIALSAKQREAIKAHVESMQRAVTDLEWSLQREVEKMSGLLSASKPDEKAVLKQADGVMALEHQIKQHHLALLIRIKSLLTSEQKAKLDTIRRESRGTQMPPRLPR